MNFDKKHFFWVTFFIFTINGYKYIKMADAEIIELIKRGKNDKALLKLYHGFPPIQKFLLQNGANKEEALDVFQDALYIWQLISLLLQNPHCSLKTRNIWM